MSNSDQHCERYYRAITLFDTANSQDPNQEISEAKSYPRELLYAQRMTACLENFKPNASEALRLAVRCQHIGRWQIPRQDYPQGRAGYLHWRTTLYEFHAQKASEILRKVGYEDVMIEQVGQLLRKKKMREGTDSQILEDVICLVFFQHYLTDFSQKHPKEKIYEIIQKTWRKMSKEGQKTSQELTLSPATRQLLTEALSS